MVEEKGIGGVAQQFVYDYINFSYLSRLHYPATLPPSPVSLSLLLGQLKDSFLPTHSNKYEDRFKFCLYVRAYKESLSDVITFLISSEICRHTQCCIY